MSGSSPGPAVPDRRGAPGATPEGGQATRYLAALVRLAAIDGVSETESAVIRSIGHELGLADESVEGATAIAASGETTEALLRDVIEPALKIALVRDAYRVATADDVVTPAELEELHALARRLGVGDLAAEAIRQVVEADRARARPGEASRPPLLRAPVAAGPGDGADVAREIAAAADVAGVARAAVRARRHVCALIEQGVAALHVTSTFSDLNDRLAARVLELVLEPDRVPGIAVCWVCLGSEGRGEQTLHTDQDNAIVFDAPGIDPEVARARLLPVARRVNEALAACGFSPCSGGIMAGEPPCCASVEEWEARFDAWMETPDPEALLRATIFFDLRPLWGDFSLADRLQRLLARRAPERRRFLALLTEQALERRPPLGFFRDFAVETDGAHAGTIDLKLGAVTPFVDAARVLALAAGGTGPATEARLRYAGPRAGIDANDIDAAVEAFRFVQVLRLRVQDDLARSGSALHNRLDPSRLNPLERRFLREALREARNLQNAVSRSTGSAPAAW